MTCPLQFVEMLRERRIALASGVPCSYLTGLINTAISHPEIQYLGAANEGDAVAIASGAELGGRHAAVLFQNSGFGNAVSPLTSLTATFRIPVLLLITWRGQPGGPADEPQHHLMGRITPELLDSIGIPWRLMPREEHGLPALLDEAVEHMSCRRSPFALLVRKGVFGHNELEHEPAQRASETALDASVATDGPAYDQDDVLRAVQASIQPNDAIVATTGYTGRALYALNDRPNQFYMVGSMGCAASLGLGLAVTQPHRKIIVLDGDGAFLMRMGAAATLGYERPPNLVHILLDNSVHDSTGGQSTVSGSLDWLGIARACGYPRAFALGCLDDLADTLCRAAEGLTFLHVKTKARRDRNLPRPHHTPVEVATRFRQWLSEA